MNSIKQRIKRKIGRSIYYSIAKRLPISYDKFGALGKWLRMKSAKLFLLQVGKNVNIEKGAQITSRMIIGDNSGVGINAIIHGTVYIGKDVMMGPNCVIYTTNHAFSRTDIPMRYQGFTKEAPVTIKDDVWIGGHVIILPGVTIGRGVIIGAGAVVAKDIPDYAVVVGNPGKIIKFRNKDKN